MASTKISDMTAAGAITGAEVVPVLQGGANVRTTVTTLLGLRVVAGSVDPSAGAGVAAAIGTIYSRTTDGTVWSKTSAPDTGWQQLAFV